MNTSRIKSAVIVNRDKMSFTATIGEKQIKMTFTEFDTMKKLLEAVLFDYLGNSTIAYIDETGKIVKY